MYDPFIVARLSDTEWRLLGSLLLTGQLSNTYTRAQIMARTGLTKNTLNAARGGLVEKGLIAVLHMKRDGVEYRLLDPSASHAFVEVVQEQLAPPPALALPAPDPINKLIQAYAERFPQDAKYPLTVAKAKEMLKVGEGNVTHVLSIFDRTAAKPGIKAPKAYILKVLQESKPPQEEGRGGEEEVVEIDPGIHALMMLRKKKWDASKKADGTQE